MKKKFNYKHYDYSFLIKKDNVSFVKRVFAKTIGYDLTTVRPMNEPVGRLFYFDNTSSALNNAITYEPIRTGGWEVELNPPTNVTVPEEAPAITTASTITNTREEETNITHFVQNWHNKIKEFKEAEKIKQNRSNSYNKKSNFFRNIILKRYGKKI